MYCKELSIQPTSVAPFSVKTNFRDSCSDSPNDCMSVEPVLGEANIIRHLVISSHNIGLDGLGKYAVKFTLRSVHRQVVSGVQYFEVVCLNLRSPVVMDLTYCID